jgi:His-Xaa-Ser system radical SAM maturase HxsC
MPDVTDLPLIDRPKRRFFHGHALTDTHTLGLTLTDRAPAGDKSRLVQVLSGRSLDVFAPGFAGYVCQALELPEHARRYLEAENVPCVLGTGPLDDLADGALVELNQRPGQVRVLQYANSHDYTLVLTNRCNCNCLMCPDSESARRNGQDMALGWIERFLSLLPSDLRHLALTGGEPTLLRERLFAVLDLCRQYLPQTQLLLLSNGRMCYYPDYARQLAQHGVGRVVVATALQAADAGTHDQITGAPGSFAQTLGGIQNLLAYGVRVEIRVVVQQANWHRLADLAALIAREIPRVTQISLMGLELLGNAAKHREQVWVDYRTVAPELSRAIRHLLQHGLAPRIYNLPLCQVDPLYWSLCAKSISDYKQTFRPECRGCSVRDHCGGLFGTALNHRLTDVRPIEGSMAAC